MARYSGRTGVVYIGPSTGTAATAVIGLELLEALVRAGQDRHGGTRRHGHAPGKQQCRRQRKKQQSVSH